MQRWEALLTHLENPSFNIDVLTRRPTMPYEQFCRLFDVDYSRMSSVDQSVQKGGDAAELEAKKKDLETRRAANANRSVKTFYKVTVEV